MKEITIYIADDGTTFDNYTECCHYECECEFNKIGTDGIQFYDENGDILNMNFNNAEDIYNLTYYINVTSENGIKILESLTDYYGFCFDIESVGFYIYLDDEFIDINNTKFYNTFKIMKKIGLIE